MEAKKNNFSGVFSLLIVSLLYGFFGILSRLIGLDQLPLYYQSGIRALFAALLIGFFMSYQHTWLKIEKKDLILILIRGIFSITPVICIFVAVNKLPISTVYFVYYAGATLGGYLLGKILFDEKLTLVKILSLAFSLIGLYLIYSFSGEGDKVFYTILSIGAGIATAFWNLLAKKISNQYSTLQLSFLDNIVGGGFAILVSITVNEKWVIPSFTPAWELNALFGCLFVVSGQLIIYGFRRVDAQIGSLIMLSEVLFAILLGAVFYKEILTLMMLVGGGLILTAIILPELRSVSSTFLFKKIPKKS